MSVPGANDGVKADVENEVAVVLGVPCELAGGPGVDELDTNHSYVGAGVEPEPLAVAVNEIEFPEQILPVVGVILTVIAGTGVTVIAIPVAWVAVLDVTHVKPVVIIMLKTSPVAIEPAAAV